MKKKIKKVIKEQKDQFVLIYWKDAAMHGTDQVSRERARDTMNVVKGISGGILVHEDDLQITMATDWFHEYDEFRQVTTIPKSGIYKVRRYYFDPKRKLKRKSTE